MRILVLAFALALLPALAAAEETCADKCEADWKACDKKNCWPARNDCIQSKCKAPTSRGDPASTASFIKCRVACISEGDPCMKICYAERVKCEAACPKS